MSFFVLHCALLADVKDIQSDFNFSDERGQFFSAKIGAMAVIPFHSKGVSMHRLVVPRDRAYGAEGTDGVDTLELAYLTQFAEGIFGADKIKREEREWFSKFEFEHQLPQTSGATTSSSSETARTSSTPSAARA
mmetsp:Transcript_13171/g.33423  ORF Transcript_13171/g.33423 Transcript_13171/m.33423 type:complete len:134 (-) Transcript_13171:104-505(-)